MGAHPEEQAPTRSAFWRHAVALAPPQPASLSSARAPLSINSPGRARLGDDAARRAGGERRLCRAGGRQALRQEGATGAPCARLPMMGVIESSRVAGPPTSLPQA